MALPLKYNLRNALTRWRTTGATILGTGVVVFVFVSMQAMGTGIQKVGANTGDPRNLLVTRRGATSEGTSQITVQDFRAIRYFEEIARDAAGEPVISADLSLVINIPRITRQGNANAVVRGLSPLGRELRPQATLVEGRWFAPGLREVAVSRRMAKRFADLGIGQRFKAGPHELLVVGHFDAGKSAFDSEIWMDADEARQLFDRANYSSLLARPRDEAAARALALRVENDKRFKLQATPEVEYYSKQTRAADSFKSLGAFLATIMSVGSIFAAMNTMYASVAARTREIGTLRVLGYKRRAVLAGFMIEGAFLALLGGVLGATAAWLLSQSLAMSGISFGTFSSETFSESVFELRVTPGLYVRGLLFSLIVGLAGSFLPALRGARVPVIAALKSV